MEGKSGGSSRKRGKGWLGRETGWGRKREEMESRVGENVSEMGWGAVP